MRSNVLDRARRGRHGARRRSDWLSRTVAGAACVGVVGLAFLAHAADTPASYDRSASNRRSAPASPSPSGQGEAGGDGQLAAGNRRAGFPELHGLKCGQAVERLRLLGFTLVVLVSVDAKLVDVAPPNGWSVTADAAAPYKAGDSVALDAVISVQCQWDGAGTQSRPGQPRPVQTS
ncbi:hypothetical protein Drose_12385 [Dactylosporangium roseum]|uniref:PASTA domain-containing protein n=1 Tax=Dactylosporangium roseum TaxID=47989 RepID=A0ABY5ZBW9_9ACTN|nr:hypothetical protein [Dactylosporangium roseum]UWZ38947.1 hypothetical protein Drose_12385 [Dactylosporangium roseum]